MHTGNIFAIAKKNLLILSHDKRTVGLLIFMPVLMMMLFGYAFGQPVGNVPIKVVNLDEEGAGIPPLGYNGTHFSDTAIDFLEGDDRVDVSYISVEDFDLEEEKNKVSMGLVWICFWRIFLFFWALPCSIFWQLSRFLE